MHTRLLLPVVALLSLAGCGYPGEPLPPALRRPVAIADLAALERGSKLFIRFTVPATTTEGLKLKEAPDLDLRIGPAPEGGWNPETWERKAARIAPDKIKVTANVASAEVPASAYIGTSVIIGVRARGPRGATLGWSNFETLTVVPPLPVPLALEARDAPDAVRLEWHAAAAEYRVFRREAGTADWTLGGSTSKPFFTDSEIAYGKEYEYFVQSVEKTGERYAESDLSAFLKFKPVDRFPPAPPSGLTAVPGTRSIELVWERNAEKDFASYRIFRDGKLISEGASAPAFSDRDVIPGRRYSYQVAALDSSGNESARSAAVEALIP